MTYVTGKEVVPLWFESPSISVYGGIVLKKRLLQEVVFHKMNEGVE